MIVVGLVVFFHVDVLTDSIHLGDARRPGATCLRVGVATVVFTGLESASGLAGECGSGAAGSSA